ncbi:uncharacterized protein LOC144513186 [Sander vitreus]
MLCLTGITSAIVKQDVVTALSTWLCPFGIICVLQLWMDKTFINICEPACYSSCCYVGYHMIKAVFVGLLWITSVLIDADWYVCCEINQSEQQKQLACKEKNNLTAEERTSITELKNDSRLYGLILVLGVVVVAAIGSSVGQKKGYGRPCCKDSSCCCPGSDSCYKAVVYEEVKLDEEENVLKEILKRKAKAEVTERLENHWQQTTVEGEWVPLQVRLSPTGNQDQIIHVEAQKQEVARFLGMVNKVRCSDVPDPSDTQVLV